MKKIIIKQMAEVVRDTMTSFQTDFTKYDMEAMENYDDRFLWFVAPAHTHLAKIGEQYLGDIIGSEEGLYAVLQRNTTPDALLGVDNNEELVFYYDGDKLEKITRSEARHLWGAIRGWMLHSWQVQNKMSALPSDFTIPVKFKCGYSYIKEQLNYAKEIGDDTLKAIFERFKHYSKVNSSHRCEIYRDFAAHSFTFAFLYNNSKTGEEVCSLNGGIIYYDGKWNTHT